MYWSPVIWTPDPCQLEHKFNIPIDLGLGQGSYGITVSTNTDMDINALADPAGIAPAYERRQRQDDLRTLGGETKKSPGKKRGRIISNPLGKPGRAAKVEWWVWKNSKSRAAPAFNFGLILLNPSLLSQMSVLDL